MVLSGQPHNPPGSVAPWMMPGGLKAFKAQRKGRRAPQVIVGVGGPKVPKAIKSFELAKVRAHRASQAQKADEAELAARARGASALEAKRARAKYDETVSVLLCVFAARVWGM